MKNENIMNETDALYDILTGEKSLVKLYGTAMTEASGKDVRKTVKSNMFETAEEQYRVFECMQKNGYYEVQPAGKAIIDEKISTFSKTLKGLEK